MKFNLRSLLLAMGCLFFLSRPIHGAIRGAGSQPNATYFGIESRMHRRWDRRFRLSRISDRQAKAPVYPSHLEVLRCRVRFTLQGKWHWVPNLPIFGFSNDFGELMSDLCLQKPYSAGTGSNACPTTADKRWPKKMVKHLGNSGGGAVHFNSITRVR